MKILIVFALCLVAANCIDKSEYSESVLSFLTQLHTDCSKRTGVDDRAVIEHHKGNFCVGDSPLKRYISCMWTDSKVLNENLEVNVAELANLFPPRVGFYLLPMYLDCIRQVKYTATSSVPIEEKTFLINACIYYRDPYEFWLF